MATSVLTLDVTVSGTDEQFRAWGKAISDSFAAGGWTKAPDTGQIDWATVLKPAAAGAAGYEMWRMGDALQATAPVFVKIEYGSFSLPGYNTIWLQLGTGSNGSGGLTGPLSARGANGSSSATTAARCLFSSGNNRIGVVMNDAVTSQGFGFVIERSHDAAGADTAAGAMITMFGAHGIFIQFAPQVTPVPVSESSGTILAPGAGNGQKGADVILYPAYTFNVDIQNPFRGYAGYFTSDIPTATIITAPIYGVSQTWMTTSGAHQNLFRKDVTGRAFALRWE